MSCQGDIHAHADAGEKAQNHCFMQCLIDQICIQHLTGVTCYQARASRTCMRLNEMWGSVQPDEAPHNKQAGPYSPEGKHKHSAAMHGARGQACASCACPA